ncbi:hypothetical protein SDC9_202387 [bioreactor metagenome]|uniref:Uncharacterized protein n=1 Tax=bioreactor metagenome TaxID=1076179 RepID=A0A645IV08_9ZZZZ
MTPLQKGFALGIGEIAGITIISCTSFMSMPYSIPPTDIKRNFIPSLPAFLMIVAMTVTFFPDLFKRIGVIRLHRL